MDLILIMIVLILLFGSGGYYGRGAGWFSQPSYGAGYSLFSVLFILIVVLVLLRYR